MVISIFKIKAFEFYAVFTTFLKSFSNLQKFRNALTFSFQQPLTYKLISLSEAIRPIAMNRSEKVLGKTFLLP